MIFDRRGFVAAGSAALLSGCATTGSRRELACTALPPVKVDSARIIRTVAGLRPYRASGFVVRREQLADTALVHNYGHGGAGITLSWSRFQILAGERYGVRWLPTYEESQRTEPTASESFMPGWRVLSRGDHPFPVAAMVSYRTMYVETPRFLRQLTADILSAGGKIQLRKFASHAELASLPETLIFNCTGIGARDLFGDAELQPVRGQLAVLQPQAEVLYATAGRWGYMFPRADGILLGGTFERDVWDTIPNPADIADIVSSHRRFFDELRCTA